MRTKFLSPVCRRQKNRVQNWDVCTIVYSSTRMTVDIPPREFIFRPETIGFDCAAKLTSSRELRKHFECFSTVMMSRVDFRHAIHLFLSFAKILSYVLSDSSSVSGTAFIPSGQRRDWCLLAAKHCRHLDSLKLLEAPADLRTNQTDCARSWLEACCTTSHLTSEVVQTRADLKAYEQLFLSTLMLKVSVSPLFRSHRSAFCARLQNILVTAKLVNWIPK